MLLVLTNSEDATADYLIQRVQDASIKHTRINTDRISQDIALGYADGDAFAVVRGSRLSPQSINHVWLRRPGKLLDVAGLDLAEQQHVASEWGSALEGILAHIPQSRWMNHPANNVGASHKIEQLTRARQLGLTIPDTLVTQDPDALRLFRRKHVDIIIKPLSGGYLERHCPTQDTVIYTSRVEQKHLDDLDELLPACPTLFQAMVQKEADIRVTIVDNQISAVAIYGKDEQGNQRLDIRRNSMVDVRYEVINLPVAISKKVLELVKSYDLRFAAIDLALARNGDWVFFEVNPNGQWAWTDLEGVTDIAASFLQAFSNA